MNRGVKYLLVALGLLVAGIILGFTQFVWVTPPWVRLTPIIYFLLLMAWVPVFFYGLWILIRGKRGLLIPIAVIVFVGQCCLLLTLSPAELGYLGMYGGEHPVLGGSFSCHETDARSLTCELCIISSDDPPETLKTYHFRTFGALVPVMLLTGSSVEDFDTWHTPPCQKESQ